MYFPVSFSRNFSAARRRAISFWRSVSWGGAGSVVAMGTSSTGAAASAGASPGSDRSRTRRQRAHGRARGFIEVEAKGEKTADFKEFCSKLPE